MLTMSNIHYRYGRLKGAVAYALSAVDLANDNRLSPQIYALAMDALRKALADCDAADKLSDAEIASRRAALFEVTDEGRHALAQAGVMDAMGEAT